MHSLLAFGTFSSVFLSLPLSEGAILCCIVRSIDSTWNPCSISYSRHTQKTATINTKFVFHVFGLAALTEIDDHHKQRERARRFLSNGKRSSVYFFVSSFQLSISFLREKYSGNEENDFISLKYVWLFAKQKRIKQYRMRKLTQIVNKIPLNAYLQCQHCSTHADWAV